MESNIFEPVLYVWTIRLRVWLVTQRAGREAGYWRS